MSNDIGRFVRFVDSGSYGEMKNAEQFLECAKEELRSMLYEQDGKRFEFPEAGMVARFTVKSVREINQEQLIEDLSDYLHEEQLLEVLEIDKKKLTPELIKELDPFLLPATYYAKPTLNKVGKGFRRQEDVLFGGQSELELISEIRDVAAHLKRYKEEYEDIRSQLMADAKLREAKKIKTKVGSISYVPHKREYNKQLVLSRHSFDFFKKYGKVNMEKLNKWIEMGLVQKWILTANNELKDLNVTFSCMTLEAEAKMFQGMNWKKEKGRRRIA